MSSPVETLTNALPTKIAVSIYHLNEVSRTLRGLNRQLDPATTDADYQSIVQFREALPMIMEQMCGYLRDIETQYGEFYRGTRCPSYPLSPAPKI
jgi:hypothetical protein